MIFECFISLLRRLLLTAFNFSFMKYDDYISQDNRGKKSRISMPLSKLRIIVEEINKIPLNLGNAATKMTRIYSQSEDWIQKYYPLLKQCGIECSYTPSILEEDCDATGAVTMDQLDEAVSDADAELSIDLEEVLNLKGVVKTTQSWIDKASVFSSKKDTTNSTTGKKKKGSNSSDDKHSMEEMSVLIEEAATLPVDISNELNLLKIEQSKVVAWRLEMQRTVKEITASFGSYSRERARLCSVNFSQSSASNAPQPPNNDSAVKPDETAVSSNDMRQNVTRQQSKSRSNSFATDDTGRSGAATPSAEVLEQNAFPLVTNFLRSAKTMKVITPETLLSEELASAMSWLSKSFKFLSSHSEAYDRKNSSALDKLVKSGQTLLKFKTSVKEIPEDSTLVDDLRECWASIVNDDLDKLVDLKDKRSKFFDWCEKADEIISDADTKIPIETLKKLDEESTLFPSSKSAFQSAFLSLNCLTHLSHRCPCSI